jgi:hypothetical protein
MKQRVEKIAKRQAFKESEFANELSSRLLAEAFAHVRHVSLN